MLLVAQRSLSTPVRDDPNTIARALDALAGQPVGVTMRVLAMTLARLLMAVMRVMFVRPGVRVGVTQPAVTVQVAFDRLMGGGGTVSSPSGARASLASIGSASTRSRPRSPRLRRTARCQRGSRRRSTRHTRKRRQG